MLYSLGRACIISAIILQLFGCTIFPGSHMPVDNKNTSPALPESFNLIHITPKLVNELSIKKHHPSENKNSAKEMSSYEYLIGVGDVLNIIVWKHPELTTPQGDFRPLSEGGNIVSSRGTIFYPYIGEVKVSGLSLPRARDLIKEKLSNYIDNPQVDVLISDFKSKKIHVNGAVHKPGYFPITNIPITILDAINYAGGVLNNSDWDSAVLVHNNKKTQLPLRALLQYGDLNQNKMLYPGDSIYVPFNTQRKIYVLGEFNDNKPLMMDKNGMVLAEAISAAGGISENTANGTEVFLIRTAHSGNKLADIYQFNFNNALDIALSSRFDMYPDDVVYINSTDVVRWNRVISKLLPFVNFGKNSIELLNRVKRWPQPIKSY
ncbi:polysaccharide export protein [Serratia bockelmannii]|uniref:polysaccharide export protein n=1 Tax=Serratia bockelmannii TaxID=2703793 RepID=UPI00235E77F4|nr:polysaccharide export protein [Serratia bockelmannii]